VTLAIGSGGLRCRWFSRLLIRPTRLMPTSKMCVHIIKEREREREREREVLRTHAWRNIHNTYAYGMIITLNLISTPESLASQQGACLS